MPRRREACDPLLAFSLGVLSGLLQALGLFLAKLISMEFHGFVVVYLEAVGALMRGLVIGAILGLAVVGLIYAIDPDKNKRLYIYEPLFAYLLGLLVGAAALRGLRVM